ncbi:Mobile element protein (plasmid) [Candidatus Enterovibrio altilux]|uniref:Mobile element protein n=1 Tax=Candidatus Enterovibrio altilux TaxID=1927128 RepID=A0A291BAX9_9GAMM|nr:Mobile element protein [Candidatus Enterovibrio luxaltus]
MFFHALRIHEITVLRHFKEHWQPEKLKSGSGVSDNYLFMAEIRIIIEHLNKFTCFYIYQIVAYA